MSNMSNDIPEGFKMTQFGTLPEDWEVARLGDLAKTKAGGTPSTLSSEFWDGDIPWINSGALKDQLITKPTRYITKLGLENSVAKLLPVNSVVIALTGATTGRVGLLNFVCSTNQSVVGILPNRQFDSVFLFYTLMYSRERVIGLKSGAAQPHINKQIVDTFAVPLPPLPEQRAIACVLSTIHQTIKAQDKIIAAARETKKSLMRHLFTYGPVPVAEAEKVPLRETEIGPVPERWEVVRLGRFSELITKGSSPNWQGFQYCDKGIIFIRSQNIGSGRLELEGIAHLPEAFNRKEKRSMVQKGDLLINIVGASIGRAAVAEEFIEGGNLNQAVALVRLKADLEPAFVMDFLLGKDGQQQLHKQKKEIARANLSLQDVNNLVVPRPSTAEQQQISHMLSVVAKKIQSEEARRTSLQNLFRTMLHHLMAGKVRVNDLEGITA